MNSYPPDLLVQLAPVMFIAGLELPVAPEPIQSVVSESSQATRHLQDPFTVLTMRLRDALLSQRTTSIWQPEKSKIFQSVLVDKVRSVVL
jgi:trafficking protein particle complex subunit 11